MRKFFRRYKAFVIGVMALASFVALFGPSETGSTATSIAASALEAISAFFEAKSFYIFAYERPFLLLLAFGFAYTAIIIFRYRDLPLSVLDTIVTVQFDEPDGSVVTVTKKQFIRANQPGVTAYHMDAAPYPGGTIDPHEISCWLNTTNYPINEGVEPSGKSGSPIELIHSFDPALPFAWYLPLIPDRILLARHNLLPKFLRKFVVQQWIRTVYRNDFNQPGSYFELRSTRYPHRAITVKLCFDPRKMPSLEDIVARRIVVDGVRLETVHQIEESANCVYEIRADWLSRERLRISWTLPSDPNEPSLPLAAPSPATP